MTMSILIRTAAAVLMLLVVAVAEPDSGQPFGFAGFEIYKFQQKISLLDAADLDGDGMNDVLIANNSRAKIEVLLRRKEPVAPKAKTGEKLPNDLVDDRFYERKEILTEKAVYSLAVADLNGDKKQDVAYYGKPPAELVVAYGDGKGGFPESARFPVEEGSTQPSGMATGDLNGDGRTDIVLLSKSYTSIYRQSEKGGLLEPQKIPHSIKGVTGLSIVDLDGDGREDLVHVVPASPRSVRVILQRSDGSLGAEISFQTTPWRTLDFYDLDPAKGAEMLVVQRTSGVMRSLKMQSGAAAQANPLALGGAQIHAFDSGASGKARAMAMGDVDGDGRTDIVVTEPGTAQVAIYLQGAKGELRGRRLYPSLSNSESVCVADLDGDKRAEVIVLSSSERTVGVSSLQENGQLPFPTMLSLPGTPKAIETNDVNGDGRADLLVIAEVESSDPAGKSKKKTKKRVALVYLQAESGSGLDTEPTTIELAGLKNAPDGVMLMDLDQDGHADLLMFDKFGPVKIWTGDGKGSFADIAKKDGSSRSGLVNRLARGSVNPGDLNGDGKAELLVASKNFARAIRLDPAKGLQVIDQANAPSPRAKVKGAVALDVDGDGKAEVALFDAEKSVISILRRDETGVFVVAANMSVGKLDFQAMFNADINGDGKSDLVVLGKDLFAVLYAAGTDREFTELHTVESSMRNARLYGFSIGDLNSDGDPDIAVLDGGNRSIVVFAYDPEKGFTQRINWRVHEKKMHENSRRDGGAREVIVEDLNGDGRDDIAVLIHDRLLVYLQ